jgi:HD-GYP domain-containing protein (c-di-GMP phosphodiesterase class II)
MKSEMIMMSREEENLESILYEEAKSQMDKIFQDIKKGLPFSITSPAEIVAKFIDSLIVREDLLKNALYTKGPALDFTSHLVNVCIFAIEIGIGLRYSRDDLERLGLAAIVHDLGVIKIPENILKKPGRLTEEEFAIVKKHPEDGAKILKVLGNNYLWLSEITLQEHERFNGKGYPRGLKGNEIHEYALIIGIADVYEALTHHRFQRKNLPPFDSMKEILSVERSSFPEKIIKALIAKLPVFPVGTIVRLNSKEIGVVVSTDSCSPFRPAVEIVFDPSGRKPAMKRIINLKENPLLYITSLVSEEEIHSQ